MNKLRNNCICVLLFVLFIQNSYAILEAEQGVDTTLNQNSSNILKDSNNVPRFEQVRVNFDESFTQQPKVALSIDEVSWVGGGKADFKVKLLEVDTKGFSYKVTVNFDREFTGVSVRWFAFVDPHLQIDTQEYKVFDINGDSEKSVSYMSYEFERSFVNAPNVAVFLLGASFNDDGGVYDVYVDADQISNKGFELAAGTYTNGNPYSVYVQIVILPQERSALFQQGGSNADGSLHNLKTRTQNIRRQSNSGALDSEAASEGIVFYGLSGFSSTYKVDLDVYVNSYSYDQQNQKWNLFLGSPQTMTTHANFDLFTYLPNDDCAFLFSGCNFSGNGISVCQTKAQDSFQGTHLEENDIRSIYVPEGQSITLFENENQSGRTATYEQSQECLDQLTPDDEKISY